MADFRYKRHYKAEAGQDGGSANCTGKSGQDLIVKVPQGTIVKDEETGMIIADLTKPGQTAVIAKGGKGGKGNQHFATPTRQIPSFAKAGDQGDEKWVLLELKLLADVGLLGFPNVGKSTLLSVVSAAKPKIADYHFTTIEPNLGVVSLPDIDSFVIADIPGLIEGAHEGTGLGHEFLKHVERTKLLIHLVDISASEYRDPVEDFRIINEELRKYNQQLSERPQIVAANKMDVTGAEENLKRFREAIEPLGYKVFPISAASNQGVKELMYAAAQMLKTIPDSILTSESDTEVVYTAEEEKPFEVRRENNTFIVEGKWIRKLVASTNFGNYESLQYFQRAIKKKGVVDELERLGIKEGDTVKVHDWEFDYIR